MTHANGQIAHVTAAEISRNFGQWQDRAIMGPVVVTHHGRPRVVIISADKYATLTQEGSRSVPQEDGSSDPQTSLAAVLNHVSDGFISLDRDLRITAANKVASAYFNLGVEKLVGAPLSSILPEQSRPLLVEYCRRVLRSGEAVTFELGGPEESDRHIQVHAFPYPNGLGVSFTNRTELRTLQEYMADLNSIRAALAAQSAVSFVTLNVRGYMSGCNESFATLAGVAVPDLQGKRMTDYVPGGERSRVMAALDQAVERREVVKIESAILFRDGGDRRVSITMAPIIRQVAPEGVSVILAPLPVGSGAEVQAPAQARLNLSTSTTNRT